MDQQDFDNLARTVATEVSRRHAIKVLAKAGAGGLLALVGLSRAGAQPDCLRSGERCEGHLECCGDLMCTMQASGPRTPRCCPPGAALVEQECVCPGGQELNATGDACVCEGSGEAPCGGACCEDGLTCVDGTCRASCSEDADCETGVCRDGKCSFEIACPICESCQACDVGTGTDLDACAPCESPCFAAELCAEAEGKEAYRALALELVSRGFVASGDATALTLSRNGIHIGEGLDQGYLHTQLAGIEARLHYLPDERIEWSAYAVVLRSGTPQYGLALDRSGQVQEIPASSEAMGGAESLHAGDVSSQDQEPKLSAASFLQPVDPRGCSECYQMCDDLNSAVGNGFACWAAGFVMCLRARNPAAAAICGLVAGIACNLGSEECHRIFCEWNRGCPRICDPACENLDPDTGQCFDICTKPNTRCSNRTCVCRYVTCGDACCAQGEKCQEGTCVPDCDPCWFPNNEGQCFNVCEDSPGTLPRECCVSASRPDGVCCLREETCCDGACVDTDVDSQNCGACGNRCSPEQICRDGRCVCPDEQSACGPTCCPAGQECCDDVCADLQSDPAHCGSCGNACAAGETCEDGVCGCGGQTCASPDTCCDGTCADLQSDPAHCGTCGNACAEGQTCEAGICVCDEQACSGACCDGTCVDTQSDPANCGACGNACAEGESCDGGVCVPAEDSVCIDGLGNPRPCPGSSHYCCEYDPDIPGHGNCLDTREDWCCCDGSGCSSDFFHGGAAGPGRCSCKYGGGVVTEGINAGTCCPRGYDFFPGWPARPGCLAGCGRVDVCIPPR